VNRVRQFDPGAVAEQDGGARPATDLDNGAAIERMVSLFYRRLLADPLLASVFLDVARIDLDQHLPVIAAYWKKMLLGEPTYRRHMMARHREVHRRQPLTGLHHERWLGHFTATLDAHFQGPLTDRARCLAARIIDNLYARLSQPGG